MNKIFKLISNDSATISVKAKEIWSSAESQLYWEPIVLFLLFKKNIVHSVLLQQKKKRNNSQYVTEKFYKTHETVIYISNNKILQI